MKIRLLLTLAVLSTLNPLFSTVYAQGSSITSFTYQGRLNGANGPASGLFDFQFSLYPASFGTNNQVDTTVSSFSRAVTNGLFTAPLSFPMASTSFDGNDRWLEIAVRPSLSGSNFVTLSPRQQITAAPYAIRAANLSGLLPQSQLPAGVITNNRTGVTLSGTFTGNGAALSSLNAASLTGTILDARLSPNVALRGGGNAFTGNQTVSGGNVGIGTTTPSATLDVAGTIRADYLLLDPVDGGTEGGEILLKGAAAFPDWVMDLSGSSLRFHTIGGVKLQIDPAAGVTAYGNLSFGDATSSLQFPSVSSASPPMINMFAGGFANANRMVLAHSPAFANWGLQYQDVTDQFDFLAGGSPVMTVALGSRNVGIGTLTPQSSLHVYSANNPTVVRVQSAGAPGFGRIEFVSNPQGDANEWRPGYIQSLDAGGFTGGLGFYVNGAGAGSKFGSVEAMRLLASGLYVNTSILGSSPSGNGVRGNSGAAGNSGVYGENTGQGFGVAGRTTGGGVAVYGDNTNPAGWAGYFNGNLGYTGQLNKFDMAENFTATVRAADFLFGHSTRRGTPGRALVDLTDTLYLNFASDWANTYIGGNNVSVCTLTIRGGCDIAEPFQMTNKEIPKGAVVVIDEDNAGHLKMSDQACDRRVAGIISGANGVNTGVTLTQEGVFEGGQNVALSGRVYVQADASNGPIKPGDLLTTSDVPGHAMKVTDHARAQGAILGKAMTALKEGRGMVLVLVTLQ